MSPWSLPSFDEGEVLPNVPKRVPKVATTPALPTLPVAPVTTPLNIGDGMGNYLYSGQPSPPSVPLATTVPLYGGEGTFRNPHTIGGVTYEKDSPEATAALQRQLDAGRKALATTTSTVTTTPTATTTPPSGGVQIIGQQGTLTAEGQTALTQANTGFSQNLQSISAEIDQLVNATRNDTSVMALINHALSGMLTSLGQIEQKILGDLRAQQNMDDPALQSAIGLIREEVTRQRDAVLEDMNARGLAQSGILLEMEDRINKNQLSQTQQLVSTHLSALQERLNQAVMSFSQQRLSVQGQFSTMMVDAASRQQDRVASVGQWATGAKADLAQMGQTQINWEADQTFKQLESLRDEAHRQRNFALAQQAQTALEQYQQQQIGLQERGQTWQETFQGGQLQIAQQGAALDQQRFESSLNQFAQTHQLNVNELNTRVSQFAQTLGLQREQIQQEAIQWAQTYGLNRDQFNASVTQFAQRHGLDQAQLRQQATQFAQSLGLDREQFAHQQTTARQGILSELSLLENLLTTGRTTREEALMIINTNIPAEFRQTFISLVDRVKPLTVTGAGTTPPPPRAPRGIDTTRPDFQWP